MVAASPPASFRMIYIVLGTRAQLVKMAPVMRELERRKAPLRFLLTGQHRETIEDLVEDFQLRTPREMVYRGPEAAGVVSMVRWAAACLWQMWRHRQRWFPSRGRNDVIVVHGDTFSTLVGALVGRLLGITVAHVESGLRSFNWWHPFPEELTRLAVFRLANIAFCPGEWAAANLAGYRHLKIIDSGHNTLLDAVRYALALRPAEPAQRYVVVSVHRFENLYSKRRLERIVSIVRGLTARFPVIMVLHPVTERALARSGQLETLRSAGVELRPRTSYTRFLSLMAGATAVLTDGGSNQEELSYLGVPALLLRDATERQEGLGRNAVLVGDDETRVTAALAELTARAPSRNLPEGSPSAIVADGLAWCA